MIDGLLFLLQGTPCENLTDIEHTENLPASNSLNNYRFGDVITVSCSPGYAFNETSPDFDISCNESGQWVLPTNSCQGKNFSNSEKLKYIALDTSFAKLHFKSQFSFHCILDYLLL